MKVLLSGLPALEVNHAGGERIPILERVVDHVPYTRFQNFRGPYACKHQDGQLRLETQLRPEVLFEQSELSGFAGHVDPSRALPLPSIDEMLTLNPELRELSSRQRKLGGESGSIQDMALYSSIFQRPGSGTLDLSGFPEIERYEEALKWLNPERAIQWWSWFRICGVTYSMLKMHGDSAEKRDRIWSAHHAWSSQYSGFTVQENVMMVEKCQGRRISGLSLLMNLLRFDNPDMNFRANSFQVHRPPTQTSNKWMGSVIATCKDLQSTQRKCL
jgi:hypothetical protein